MKKHSFIVGAFMLTVGGILAKVVGAFYKIPLTNMLGTNGMGIYYLIFPLYSLLLVLVSQGISIGITKLVADERGKNVCRKNERTILIAGIIYVTIMSVILGGILVIFAAGISNFQGNINAKFGYYVIAPALLFASIISVLKGYFQGQENMLPSSVSGVVSQIVKVVAGLLLANIFLKRGDIYGVVGAILGVTIAEGVTLIYLIIEYLVYKHKNIHLLNKCNNDQQYELTLKDAFKKLLSYSLMTTLSSIIVPITALLDSFMVINILTNSGFSSTTSTSLYGISSGIVSNLIGLPVIVIASFATVLLPNLAMLYSQQNMKEINFRCVLFIKISWVFSLFCFVVYLILSPDIVNLLYSGGLKNTIINEYEYSYKLLMISSISIIYYAFLQTFTSMLQSINKPLCPFISLLIALIVRTALVVVLVRIPEINIFGLVLANIVFLLIATLINLVFVRKYIPLSFNAFKMFVIPIFSAVLAGSVLYITKLMLGKLGWISITITGIISLTVYALAIICLRCFTTSESKHFPLISRFKKVRPNKDNE